MFSNIKALGGPLLRLTLHRLFPLLNTRQTCHLSALRHGRKSIPENALMDPSCVEIPDVGMAPLGKAGATFARLRSTVVRSIMFTTPRNTTHQKLLPLCHLAQRFPSLMARKFYPPSTSAQPRADWGTLRSLIRTPKSYP